MFFDKRIQVRIRSSELREIEAIIRKDSPFKNVSHFCRIAIIKEVRLNGLLQQKDECNKDH